MIGIKSEELREAVKAVYDFDVLHGECTDTNAGYSSVDSWNATYKFNDKVRTYYFQGGKLDGYEDKP